jgi:hypothetical protein
VEPPEIQHQVQQYNSGMQNGQQYNGSPSPTVGFWGSQAMNMPWVKQQGVTVMNAHQTAAQHAAAPQHAAAAQHAAAQMQNAQPKGSQASGAPNHAYMIQQQQIQQQQQQHLLQMQQMHAAAVRGGYRGGFPGLPPGMVPGPGMFAMPGQHGQHGYGGHGQPVNNDLRQDAADHTATKTEAGTLRARSVPLCVVAARSPAMAEEHSPNFKLEPEEKNRQERTTLSPQNLSV